MIAGAMVGEVRGSGGQGWGLISCVVVVELVTDHLTIADESNARITVSALIVTQRTPGSPDLQKPNHRVSPAFDECSDRTTSTVFVVL
jgi:hypothetical protein